MGYRIFAYCSNPLIAFPPNEDLKMFLFDTILFEFSRQFYLAISSCYNVLQLIVELSSSIIFCSFAIEG
jgi:hypothetical protein